MNTCQICEIQEQPGSWPAAPVEGTEVTLSQATWWLSPDREAGPSCACVGPHLPVPGMVRCEPPYDRLCPCHRRTIEARALHQAAHIVAKLLTDTSLRDPNRYVPTGPADATQGAVWRCPCGTLWEAIDIEANRPPRPRPETRLALPPPMAPRHLVHQMETPQGQSRNELTADE